MSALQYVDHEQGSIAWRRWREARRMASETPVLLGLSKYSGGVADLWQTKVTGEEPVADAHVIRMREFGHRHEAAARAAVEEYLQIDLQPACFERGDWAASFDGADWDLGEDSLNVIAEIKCPWQGASSTRWKCARELGTVRPDDMAQIQHQLMVSRAARAYYAVYLPETGDLACLPVAPDPDIQAQIVAAWDAFWPHIESGTRPDGLIANRDDEPWAEAVEAYRAAKAADAAAAKALKTAEDHLRALAGKDSARGAGLVLTRYYARGSVDYAAIPSLAGIDLELYRKPGAWRSRITLEKTK